jgi:MFS transporter, FSR family, fosmidomycin resistance protein
MGRAEPVGNAHTHEARRASPNPDRGRGTTAVRRGQLALLSISHVVDDLYQGAVPALVALLVLERHYSYTAATGITLAATILSSVVQPVFGLLADRHTMRWLVPSGLALAGVGIGLAGLGHSYAWTWTAVAVSGLGVAAYHPDASRLARVASGGTASGMSWFALGGNLGFALGPTLTTSLLLATGLGGSPLLAAPALLTAGLLPLALRRGSRAPAEHPTPEPSPAATAAAEPARTDGEDDDAQADNWRAFGWLTSAVMARSVLFFGLSALLALYLQHHLDASPTAASAALTLLLGTGAAATLLGGRLADRFGRVAVIRLGYLMALPGLLGLLLAPNLALALTAVVVLGVATYLPFSVQVTLGQDYLPRRIGTASGVTLGLAVSAGGLVVPLLGLLADHTDLRLALATLLTAPLTALLVTSQLHEPGHPTQSPTGGATSSRPGGAR